MADTEQGYRQETRDSASVAIHDALDRMTERVQALCDMDTMVRHGEAIREISMDLGTIRLATDRLTD